MSTLTKRRLVIVAAAIVLVIIGVVILIRWMNGDANGNVHVGSPVQTTAKQAAKPLTITNRYFTTTLPAGYTLRRQADTPGSPMSLLHAVADTTGEQGEQFAATVGTIPSDGLKAIGDYNLRATQTADYQIVTLPGLPTGATAFRTTSAAPAITVFWPHGTLYAELAFSSEGGASLERLTGVYGQALASWQWR